MCKSGPPADGPNLHVSFYPGRRWRPHFASSVLSGPPAHGTMLQKIYIRTPADGSQRVKEAKGDIKIFYGAEGRTLKPG